MMEEHSGIFLDTIGIQYRALERSGDDVSMSGRLWMDAEQQPH